MAKLIILVATVFAALLLVDASIYRATVVIEDEANPARGQDCRQQFDQQQKLRNCQEFIRYRSRQSQRGMNPQREEEQQELQRCCAQLQNMESQCRCEALEYATAEMQRGAGQETQRRQEVLRVAQQIPSICQLSPGQCQFGQRSLY